MILANFILNNYLDERDNIQDSDLDMFASAELSHCPECNSELDNDSYCKECDIFFGEVKWQTI